jgi:crotonobetaine/carnitine-CoA ligase
MTATKSNKNCTTIPAHLKAAIELRGRDWQALDFSGEQFTLGQLDEQSDQLAAGLAALGLVKGQTVASILDNSWDQVVLLFAAGKLGAIHVPVNTAYKGDFLCHQLADSSANILIAEPDYAERITAIENGLPEAQHLLVRGELPANQPKKLAMQRLRDVYSDAVPPTVELGAGDLAMLIYTAGTTGPSKGCMVTHGYAANMSRQLAELNGIKSDDVIWTPLPGFHMNQIATTLLSAMLMGARASIYPRFSVSNFWPEIERSGATSVSLLASMLNLIADAPETEVMKRCFGQIRVVIGAPFPEALVSKWQQRFGVTYGGSAGFGLTECALITSVPVSEQRPPNSAGRRNDDFDVRIAGNDDVELPNGQAGEILVRPKKPHVMFAGFWKRPEDTLKLMTNLWYHTGDIGKFDDEGFFYFVDRKKDYLRRRGENISSFEMESTFRMHGDIVEVAVHAAPSELGEDELKVTAILKEDATLTEEDLCRWSVERVPYFAVPRFIEFRSELPKNPVGRVLKYQLRDEGVTSATWDREKSGFVLEKR